jgi:sarcosine oxidase
VTTGRTEVAVIGAGVIGLAVADSLMRSGAGVRCFERAAPGGGQSGGLTRIFRHVHFRRDLVELVVRARAGWRQWEARAGRRLVGEEGALYVGADLEEVAERLAGCGVPCRVVGPDEQRVALPLLGAGAERAVLDPGGGAIRARRTVGALATWLGEGLVSADVIGLHPDGGGVLVHTTEGLWRAERALVCAGERTPEFAEALGTALPVTRAVHVRATFAPRAGARSAGPACWIDLAGATGEAVYGSPVGSTGRYALGLADHSADAGIPAAAALVPADATVAPAVARLGAYVASAMPGLDPEPVGLRLCVTTALPWHRDAFAAWSAGPVTLFAGNNLFKFAPLIGRLLAESVLSGEVVPALAPATAASVAG